MFYQKTKEKERKVVDIEDIRAQLRNIIGGIHARFIDVDCDLYMYPANMHPSEQDDYRAIVCASKATN